MSKKLLLNYLPEEWGLEGEPAFRQKQVLEWVCKHRAGSFSEMSNIPEAVRRRLDQEYSISPLRYVRHTGSEDTTRKYLWKLEEGDFVESVWIPASPALYGEASDRFTLCVSSQVGCAYGCKFCASGLAGFKRNLSAAEIVAQVIEAERMEGNRVGNIVFMGMGEPLANDKEVMRALDIINSPDGLNIGARHITLSTSGLAPEIRKLADDSRQFRLAVSLHAATDDVRNQIMPVNRKYGIKELMEACHYFVDRKRKVITFEYILIDEVNSGKEQAERLASFVQGLKAKVNLIPYNRVEGLNWQRPDDEVVDRFVSILNRHGVRATVRREKGHDIDAACGQLRLQSLEAV